MLTKTPEAQAAEYANGLLNMVNQFEQRVHSLTTNGAAANPQIGAPAVTAEQIVAALGPVNLTKIQTAIAALG
jgi:hypothetical protein